MRKGIIVILTAVFLAGYVFAQTADDFDVTLNAGGTLTITKYKGAEKQVVIPETINGVKVTEIGKRAFFSSQLTSIIIPDSVTSIGREAFLNNRLTSVTIPNSVTSIDKLAFTFNQLTSVTIPDSVTAIEDLTFAKNRLTTVTISNSITSIGNSAFYQNQLTNVTIPNSVTSIGAYAFYDNPLTSVILPGDFQFHRTAFPNNLFDFFVSRGRKAGTYTWTGSAWIDRVWTAE
jgi:hypothetical protein